MDNHNNNDPFNTGSGMSEIAAIVSQLHYNSSNVTLLKDPAIAAMVLRSLNDLQRLVIIRMVNLRMPVPEKHMLLWLGNDANLLRVSLQRLLSSKLIVLFEGQTGKSTDSSSSVVSHSQGVPSIGQSEVGSNISVESSRSQSKTPTRPDSRQVKSYKLDPHLLEGLHIALSATSREGQSLVSMIRDQTTNKLIDTNKYNQIVQKCYLNAYEKWNGFLRWCFNDGVRITLHNQDAASTPNETCIAMFSTPEWRRRSIRLPPITLQKVAQRLDLSPPTDGSVGWRNEKFMFFPPQKQLSRLITDYINVIKEDDNGEGNADQLLTFFISLNQMKIGKCCRISGMNPANKAVLEQFILFLDHIGVLVIQEIKFSEQQTESIFYPTPLSKLVLCNVQDTALFASAMESPHVSSDMLTALIPHCSVLPSMYGMSVNNLGQLIHEGRAEELTEKGKILSEVQALAHALCPCITEGILVESNFKIFGYSTSSKMISLTSRFSVIKVLTPSMVNSILSRRSVHAAFALGLSASEIIEFLEFSGHYAVRAMRSNTTKLMIPENVRIQIQMWEMERKRLQFRKATLFEFNREQDLEVFPITVTKCKTSNINVTSTLLPSNINLKSNEFRSWKSSTLKEMRDRATRGDCCTAINVFNYHQPSPGQISAAPCLVVDSNDEELVTQYIKRFRNQSANRAAVPSTTAATKQSGSAVG